MSRRLWITAAAALAGSVVLAALGSGGAAARDTATAGAMAKKGGTLRVNLSNTDFEYVDPALAYDAAGWAVLYSCNLMLLNYPDKPLPEGSRLVAEAAQGFPTVSRDGKTYTFRVRTGLKFSDGTAVTAAAFARALQRAADPQEASPAIAFLHEVVGADEVNTGKAKTLTGVTAKGQVLTIRLKRPDPTFLAEIAMPFFGAVKPNMPINPKGESSYPSAGPYRITAREPGRSLVLERNRFYTGHRPANPDRIVITTNTDLNQSLLQVRSGQADYDMGGLPPSAHEGLARDFGIHKNGPGRYFVNTGLSTTYLALNTSRPAFAKVNLRRAVNWGIDRPALLRVAGAFAGKRTDQILPPNVPGYRDATIYPLKGADVAKAKQLAAGATDNITVLHTTTTTSLARAQIIQYNLRQMGLNVTLKPQPFAVAIKTAGTRGSDFDMFLIAWFADYPDPYDFVNVLLDGSNIQDQNNSNYSYLDVPAFNKLMHDAAGLAGDARYRAYGNLDIDLVKNQAPWVALSNGNVREFISPRIENYIFHPVYGAAILNALAVK